MIPRVASLLALTLVVAPATLFSPVVDPAAAAPERAARPRLATPDQVEAERIVRELLRDPALPAVQAKAKAYLAQTAIGQTPDGKARIDEAVSQWTLSLLFKLVTEALEPAVIWGTDDTPRTWLGYTLAGVGSSGDNPDHIYRSSAIDGSGQYEINGQIDLKNRPAQFVVSVLKMPAPGEGIGRKNAAAMDRPLALIDDSELKLSPEGRFRIVLGGAKPEDGTLHFPLAPGRISVLFRDVLSDWQNQQPATLEVRRTDGGQRPPVDLAALRTKVQEGLEPYVRFWATYPTLWLGGLQPNTSAGPIPREGGWGYIGAVRFQLKPDEAVLVTTTEGDAAYTGIQVVDPWMIASDGRRYLTSYNRSQVKPSSDGSYSFVVSPRDPGVANWLDSGGLHDGFLVLRWQKLLKTGTPAGLLRDFRIIKVKDAPSLPGIVPITAAERKQQQAERAATYGNRTR